MFEQALSVPTIKFDNDVISIVPNSFKFTTGAGETKVRSASVGGGNSVTVHGLDAEMQYSVVKFSLMNTINNVNRIKTWKATQGDHTIEALQRGTGGADDFSEAFTNISVTNDPEIVASADGVIEVECAGNKLE